MDKKTFKISVITPVYNMESYLEETIESVLQQSIGFEDNIQLILVNDGSPDDSYKICEKYQAMYPENIIYIKKENGGVSSARNTGLDQVKGKYVVFLDGDDTWEYTAFRKIYDFFEKSETAFDVCSCKIEFSGDFEGKTHPLDYKFTDGARVEDLLQNPDIISSTIGNSVFRSEKIGDIRFKETISAGEDSEFVNTVLLNKPLLGILPEAIFYYRRNYNIGSGSSSAPNKKSWYKEVPRDYYLSLCNKSLEKYGVILPFIQYVILYDMRWRHYNKKMMEVLSEEERKEHIALMHQILSEFDPAIIYSAKGYTQYQKLYFMNLKYGYNIIDDAELIGHRYYYKDQSVINIHARGMFRIKAFDIKDDELHIVGLTRMSVVRRPYRIYARVGKEEYDLNLMRYEKADLKGYIGEPLTEVQLFDITIPVKPGMKLSFLLSLDGQGLRMRPSFDPYIGLDPKYRTHKYANRYCLKNGYIIKYQKGIFGFYDDSKKTLIASEARLTRELLKKEGLKDVIKQLNKTHLRYIANYSKIQNRVAFISVRSDGELQGNIKMVYDQLDLPKKMLAKRNLYNDPKNVIKALRLVYSSKIVVTDDYLFLFRDYGKRKGQYFIQLWHATGAGKKFGQDGGYLFPAVDNQYHKDYDVVTVSGEASREAFASAFNIPIDRLKAIGVARTDEFFDEELMENIRKEVFDIYPEFEGKEIILYAPTFRDIPGLGRANFRPALDFKQLSEALRPNQIFVIRPHPAMTEQIVKGEYDNIYEIRDLSTNDLMIVSDMLISDYSSIMFEYALLKRPMAFFCYDYDDYDRDFYMDFENEHPGELLKTQEELFEYIRKGDHPLLENFEEFYQKYIGACDGHSTERIVNLIKEMYNK